MRDTEYYLAQAHFYAELAESMKRPDYKDRWLQTAQEWRDLAKQAEQGGESARPLMFGILCLPQVPRCCGGPDPAASARMSQKESPGTGGGPGLTGSRRAGGPGAGQIILRKALTRGCQH